MIPLGVAAWLTWNTIGHDVFVMYPSGGVVEEICFGDHQCYVPTSQVGEVFPWCDDDTPEDISAACYDAFESIRVAVRLPDGRRVYYYAEPTPERKS